MKIFNKICLFIYTLALSCVALCGCGDDNHGLSADNPTRLTLWHSYEGAAADKLNELTVAFNSGTGAQMGIYVTTSAMGSQKSLESAILNSALGKAGSQSLPDIFMCNANTAAALSGKLELVDYDDYITEDESLIYVRRFLDGGRVGADGEWTLFATAQSTEVLMLNKTAWDKFAADTGAQTDALLTWEGLLDTAASYYEWSGGEAFFGHDELANYIIIGCSQLGNELFSKNQNGEVSLNADKETMRKLWDYFCVPYIKGYYAQDALHASDSIATGEIIAMVCPSSRASYFPDTMKCEILPLPNFSGYTSYAALSGEGFATVKSDDTTEYASVVFLKWLADDEQGLSFSSASGYMPVTLDGVKTDVMSEYLSTAIANSNANSIISDTLLMSLAQNDKYVMYTPAGFANGTNARDILNNALDGLSDIPPGELEDSEKCDEYFEEWYDGIVEQLEKLF